MFLVYNIMFEIFMACLRTIVFLFVGTSSHAADLTTAAIDEEVTRKKKKKQKRNR